VQARLIQPISAAGRSWGGYGRFAAGEQHQIVGHHGGPDVGLEMVEPAPASQEALGIGGIANLDDNIADQAALADSPVELAPILGASIRRRSAEVRDASAANPSQRDWPRARTSNSLLPEGVPGYLVCRRRRV
jgi:hypothetical protein